MSTVILIRGKAATGKTTLSNKLAQYLQLPVLHKDDIYDSIAEHISDHSVRNRICFDFLFKYLQSVISSGSKVIIDYGYNNIKDVERLKSWIESQNGTLKTVLCECKDDRIWERRLSNRNDNPSPNQLITDLDELKRHYASFQSETLTEELVLNTVEDVTVLLEKVLIYLEE